MSSGPTGGGRKQRAGSYALSLLADPLNSQPLASLRDGPTSPIDLRQAAGFPAPTTLRTHLRALADDGLLEREREASFPGSATYALSAAGNDLLDVADALQSWLEQAPNGPLPLNGSDARGAVQALMEGWQWKIVRALAARSLTLTELAKLISELNYPSLQRRLGAMRLVGQISCRHEKGRPGRPYEVTAWLREAVRPIIAAARWERRHARAAGLRPIGRIDIEATLLLTAPTLRVPPEAKGVCRLVVEAPGGNGERRPAAVTFDVSGGVARCRSAPAGGKVDSSASGSTLTWLDALSARDQYNLVIGGDPALGHDVVESLRSALISEHTRSLPTPH